MADSSDYLRDLLYLDWEKAASIFSQVHGGLLKETQQATERASERRAGLGLSLGIIKPELGRAAEERASVVETRVLHHDLLLSIEDALFEAGAAVDLTDAAYDSAESARAAAEGASYVRAEGWVVLEDYARIDHIAEHFLEILAFIRRSALAGLDDAPEVQELRSAIEDQRTRAMGLPKAQRSGALRNVKEMEARINQLIAQAAEGDEPPPPEWLIDGIRKWISVFTPGRITLRVYPFEWEPAHHLVANLKRDAFVDSDLGNLLLAYGTRPTVKLTVFGLVTSVPPASGALFDPMSEYPEDDEAEAEANPDEMEEPETEAERVSGFEKAFRAMFEAMDGLEQFGRPTRYPRVTIYPIAIYRRVPVSPAT